ncbi:MAG: PTS sugar transporter subunit IIA [Treponema sp.]|nr:PTS sugar transporter subunit IIA [Treponema sp.]
MNDEEIVVQPKNIISKERIVFLENMSRDDALLSLAKTLSSAPQIKRADELANEILKREKLMSTAIGLGIAIPHVRLTSVTDLVMAVGISKTPIKDFNSLDASDVYLIFMIAASHNQHAYYLKTLSYFSSKLKNESYRESIKNATSQEEVYDLLSKE